MTDQFSRTIDYMRVSITDRCNLRCRYCMPGVQAFAESSELLSAEEILRICRAAVKLGISRFKITGGEPLVREDCAQIIAALKRQPGVEQVTITSNGLLLNKALDALSEAGLDAVNISLDSLDEERYRRITGFAAFSEDGWKALLRRCCDRGLRTKINAVLLEETAGEAIRLAALAEELPIDVRFIELMPIGSASAVNRVSTDELLAGFKQRWPDLRSTEEKRGNGPAHYYQSRSLLGCIGLIDAVSHRFCADCNRVRLTCTGQLKACLCYDSSFDLRAMLRRGCTDEELTEALRQGIYAKPRAHSFEDQQQVTERRLMSQIGG